MLSAKSALPLALLATSAVASFSGHSAHQHQSRHARAARARRGAVDPATISEGTLTAAEGCTAWYNVKSGDSCYSAIATVEGGLSLEDFYAMNPQVDGDCFNLWKGFDYCVSRTTTSSSKPETTKVAVAENHVERVATTTAQVKVVTTKRPEAATTTDAPAPTPTPEAREAADDEEEEDCDAEDEEEDVASTTAAVVRAAVQATEAPAATTTAADSANRNAAIASARAKYLADKNSGVSSSSSDSSSVESDTPAPAPSSSAADTTWQRQQAVKTTTSAAAAAQTTPAVFNSGSVNSKLAAVGISTFLGEQTGAIASWFRTNSAQDSTNGNSWCYRPYDDSMPGFAPSLKTMLASFGGDPIAAGKAFCGQEAEFTTPDGRTATLFIADAFDDRWVLTPTSVDVVKGAFAQLYGSDTDNKNDVVQGVTWRLTGNRRSDYLFNNGNPV